MPVEPNDDVNVEQVDAPVTPEVPSSPEPESDKGLIGDLTDDLKATIPKARPSEKIPPAADEQETATETEETESATEETVAEAETETQADADETESEEKLKPRTAKRVQTLLDDRKKLKQENELLKQQALARVNAPALPPQRPKELTSDHWYAEYQRLTKDGAAPESIQTAAVNYQKFHDEELVERHEVNRVQRELQQKQRTNFVSSMFEINEDHKFLVQAQNAFGFDLDPKSPMTQTMIALANQDQVNLTNNPAEVLRYAQRADAMLLRQQLRGKTSQAETLKRQQAEAAVKGLTPGKRGAPPAPKPASKKLDDLEARASLGDRQARGKLATESLAADLGM